MKFVCYNHTIHFTGPQEIGHLPSSMYPDTSSNRNYTTTTDSIIVRVDNSSDVTTKRQGKILLIDAFTQI